MRDWMYAVGLPLWYLLWLNVINVANCALHVGLRQPYIFLAAAVPGLAAWAAEGALRLPRQRRVRLYWAIVVVVIAVAAGLALLCCPAFCPWQCGGKVASCQAEYYVVYARCICGCIS